MDGKAIFNATVCIIGIAIFFIHSLDLILKKGKRGDEKNLLAFFVFTMVHFAAYLTFVLIKPYYTSNAFVMGFYTAFYVMNNGEAFLLFAYALSYVKPKDKVAKASLTLNYIFFAAFILLVLLNIPCHFFFYAENGAYVRAPTMPLSHGYQLMAFLTVFLFAITSKKLSITEKSAFSIYCVLPSVAIVLQNLLPGFAIGYLSIVAAIEVLFLFANVRKNAAMAEEETKSKEMEMRIVMSQIQPHFLYNALSSISALIRTDPEKAEKALDDFVDYMRMNLSTISEARLIPFSEELRHVQTYLSLEKIRFDDRLILYYEIKDTDFLVPPLSMQPLVENAVKHGVLQKIEGGKVILRSYEKDNAHIVEIIDDGVGFDVSSIKGMGSEHVGMKNVSYRVSSFGNGEMRIESEIGKGTKVTLAFYKEKRL